MARHAKPSMALFGGALAVWSPPLGVVMAVNDASSGWWNGWVRAGAGVVASISVDENSGQAVLLVAAATAFGPANF